LQYAQYFGTIKMILQDMLLVKILGSKNYVVRAREGGANTTPLFFLNFLSAYFAKRNLSCGDFEKRAIRNPARIPPQTPV